MDWQQRQAVEVQVAPDPMNPVNIQTATVALPPRKRSFLDRFRKGGSTVFWSGMSAVLLLLFVFLIGLLFMKAGNNNTEGDTKNRASVSTDPELSSSKNLNLGQIGELDVNGALTINGSIVVEPSSKPVTPESGQLYFDNQTQSMYFYNGQDFEELVAGSGAVTSLGGQTGSIGLGTGLLMQNGQLSVTIPNAGVTSVQGQSGAVLFVAGDGINVNGTTISNTGVTRVGGISGDVSIGRGLAAAGTTIRSTVSLTSLSATLLVTEDGNGNYSISQVGSGSSGSVALGPAVAQTDASLFPSISIDKTGASGDLIRLSVSSVDRFVVSQAGVITSGTIPYSQVTGAPATVITSVTNGVTTATGALTVGSGLSLSGNTLTASSGISAVNGTTNQINSSTSLGVVTLSLPQDINTTSTVNFNGLRVNGLGAGIVTTNGSGVIASGAVDRNSSTYFNTTLSVGNGGTGASSLSANGVLLGGGAGAITSLVSGSAGLCLTSGVGAPTWSACPGSGGVSQVNTFTGAITVQGTTNQISVGNSSGTITLSTPQDINTTSSPQFSGLTTTSTLNANGGIATSNGNVSLGSGTLTTTGAITSGAINSQTISSAANFTGTVTIQGSNSLTLGTVSSSDGSITFRNAGGTHTVALQAPSSDPTSNFVLRLPSAAGANNDCLKVDGSGNLFFGGCAAAGSGVTSLEGLSGALTINNATGTGSVITIDDATTAAKGIASFSSSFFTVSAGAVSIAANAITSTELASNSVNSSKISDGTVSNTDLANSSLTVTAGNGLSGGGSVALGASTSLAVAYGSAANTAVQGNVAITVAAGTGLSGGGSITLGAGGTSTLSVAYGSAASTAVEGNTSLTCASGTGNLSGGGNVITLGTGGSCGNITITNSPVFTGTLAVSGATITVGGAAQQGSLILNDGATRAGTVQVATLGQATTYILPDPGVASVNVCLSTGNCAGAGGGITGSGTSGRITKFTGSGTVGDSTLSESGSTVTASGNLVIQGANSLALGTSSSLDGSITFRNAAGTHTVALQAPSSDPASDLTFRLPSSYGSNGDCLQSNGSGGLSFSACTGGAGGGVTSIDGQTGVVVISNATGSAGTITIDDATTAAKGIASFSSSFFTVSAGAVSIAANAITSTELASNSVNSSKISDGTVSNTDLANSSLTVTAGNGLSGGGSVALGASTSLAVAYGSAANTAVQGNVALVCPSGSGNLSGGGTSITLGTGGTCSSISTVNNPTFTTSVTSPQYILTGAGSNGTLSVANLGQATAYTLPDPGAASATICLSTGNCAGAGGGITGSGTNDTIAKFTGTGTVGDSSITDNGTVVTIGANLNVTGSVTLTTALAVTEGGTGATNASGARTNLGAAASGANSDITSLSGLTTALSATQGGTGIASYTTGDLLYASSSTTLATLASVASGSCLVSGGVGTAPSWASCPGATGVSTVNTFNGAVTIQGTANQVSVGNSSGTITLSLPQSINTAAAPQFSGITLSGLSTGLVVSNGSGVLSSVVLDRNSATYFNTELSVANGGTGASTLATDGVLLGNGTSAISSLVAGGSGLCLVSTAGTPTWSACPGSGGVTSIDGQTGVVLINNATGSSGTITIDDATIAVKGIASFNGTNFSVSSGAVNTIQNIDTSASPTFAGINTNSITPSGALTVGAVAQSFVLQGSAASTITATGGGFTTTVGFAGVPTASQTFNFDRTLAAGTYTICTTGSVCSGYAPSTGGSYIAKNANDTSSASYLGTLLAFTNTNAGAAGVLSLTNSGTGNALQVTASGNASTSTSTGGAINLNNTGSTGAGLVVYSNQATPSGRLFVVRADNAGFNQAAGYIEQSGTGAALSLVQDNVASGGTGGSGITIASDAGGGSASAHGISVNLTGTGNANSSAANFVSSNTAHSAVQITGNETGRGTLKISHIGTGTDGNASAISIDLQGVGTAAQGIFLDATDGGTTGKLLNLRNNGTEYLTLDATGRLGLGTSGTNTATLDVRGTSNIRSTDTNAFRVQDSTGASTLLAADTSNSIVAINKTTASSLYTLDVAGTVATDSSFVIGTNSLTNGNVRKTTIVGTGGVSSNYVVVMADDGGNPRAILSTTARDPRVYGVAVSSVASGSSSNVVVSGNYQVYADTGAVSIGDQLVISEYNTAPFTSGGTVKTDNTVTSGILGIALSNKAGGSTGLVSVAVRPVSGQDRTRFQNITNAADAFVVQNAAGQDLMNFNTATTAITIGSTVANSSVTINSGTGTIAIGTGSQARAINVGTGLAAQTVTLGSTHSTSATTINAGSGSITLGAATTLSTLGATDTATYLCRNTSNQLAACNTTGAGAAFIQGGNSFGATATLGTDDANSLAFETGGNTQATIATTGATIFRNSTNTATAFQIQDSAGTGNAFIVDTATNTVGIGKAPTSFTLDVSSSIGVGTSFTLNTQAANSGNIRKNNTAGVGDVVANAVVVMNSSGQVVRSTTPRDQRVYGVSATTAVSGNNAAVVISGNYTVLASTRVACADCSSAGISVGDQVVVSSDSGYVTGNNNATSGILGIALSALGANTQGGISVVVRPVSGQATPRFQNSADGADAFRIQNAAGTDYFNVNTTSPAISIGSATANTAINIESGTGTIAIGTGAQARTVNIGTGAAAQTVTVGSTNSTSSLSLQSGTGLLDIGNDAVAKTNTINIGANSTGADLVSIGSNNASSTFTVESGTATTSLFNGATAHTIQFATGAAVQTIAIGSTNTTSATTINAGSAGITLNGLTTLSSLGAADTASYVCRNTTNQLAACNTTGAGAAFVQGGNLFGATAVLGTNDSNSLSLETNNLVQATIAVGGATQFRNTTDSATAFEVQNTAGASLFNVDTTAGSVNVYGPQTTGATTAQLNILSNGDNDAGDQAQLNIGEATTSSARMLFCGSSCGSLASNTFYLGGYDGTVGYSPVLQFTRYGESVILQSSDKNSALTNSGSLSLRTGDSDVSGNTGAVTISSGDAFSGSSGNVTIDVGTASAGIGQLNIGTANVRQITFGNTTASTTTAIRGGTGANAISLQAGASGTISIGNTAAVQTVVIGSTDTSSSTTIQSGTSGIGFNTAGTVRATFANSNTLYLGNGGVTGTVAGTPNAFTVQGTSTSTAATAGGALTVVSGAGNTSGAGGLTTVSGGAAGATGVGGGLTLQSGAGGATSGNSGAIILQSGNTTSGTAGNISFDVGTSSTGNGTINIGTASRTQDIVLGNTTGGTVKSSASIIGNGSATGTTGTTTGTGTDTTALTLTADAFNVGDVVLIDNTTAQDFYTRITVDPATGSYTVSPAVTFETGRTVTKYTIQNVGATASDYTTQANRFFQGYFLGGIVTGSGSTTYSDGRIQSSNDMSLHAASSFTVQNTTDSSSTFKIQNANGVRNLQLGTSPPTSLPNLVTDGGSELGVTQWTARSGTTLAQSTLSRGGSASARATVDAAGEGLNYPITLADGTYTVTFFTRFSATAGNFVSFGYSNDGSTESNCKSSQSVPNTGSWRLQNCTFTAASANGSAYFYVKTSDAASRFMYIDDFQIVSGDNAGPYGEGTLRVDALVTSPLGIRTLTDTSSALSVQDSNGVGVFSVDTDEDRVGIGTDKPTSLLDLSAIYTNETVFKVRSVDAGFNSNFVEVEDSTGAEALRITYQGVATFKTLTNNATGFVVQNSSSNNRLVVDTTTGTTSLYFDGTDRGERVCGSHADGATGLSIIGDCAVAGADIAEYYDTDGTLEPGDVVIPVAGTYKVGKSTAPYQENQMGAVSTNPLTDTFLGESLKTATRQPIGLSGRLPLKVSLENGPIAKGDYLTAGSIPGTAMKAVGPGRVIAIALEDYDGSVRVSSLVSAEEVERTTNHASHLVPYTSNPALWPANVGKIMAFISVTYHIPTQHDLLQGTTQSFNNINIAGKATVNNLEVTGSAVLQSLVVSGSATFGTLNVSGNVQFNGELAVTGSVIIGGNITVGGHIITSGTAPAVTVLAAAGLVADGAAVTITGNDTSGTITITTASTGTLAAGDLADVVFSSAYAGSPKVVITPVGIDAAKLGSFVTQNNSSFKLGSANDPALSKTYTFNYFIVQ